MAETEAEERGGGRGEGGGEDRKENFSPFAALATFSPH